MSSLKEFYKKKQEEQFEKDKSILNNIELSTYNNNDNNGTFEISQPKTLLNETSGEIGVLASVTSNLSPIESVSEDGCNFNVSPSSTYYNGTEGSKPTLIVRIISASNIGYPGSLNPVNYFCTISLPSNDKKKVIRTQYSGACSSPVWNESFTIELDDPLKEVLIINAYYGLVGIDLSKLPLGIEMLTNEPLSLYSVENRNKQYQSKLQIGLTAVNFGWTNISTQYYQQYFNWRNQLIGLSKSDYKNINKLIKSKQIKLDQFSKKDKLISKKGYKLSKHGFIQNHRSTGKTILLYFLYVLAFPIFIPYFIIKFCCTPAVHNPEP